MNIHLWFIVLPIAIALVVWLTSNVVIDTYFTKKRKFVEWLVQKGTHNGKD